MNREELELYDKQLERMTAMLNLPQGTPIPVPGTKEWDEWQAEQIRRNELPYMTTAIIPKLERGQKKQYGSISLTQKEYSKVLKNAKKKMKEELKQLRKKQEEENIKSDFYMTHEIAKISGEIKGILMIYEALEEVTNDAI